MSFGFFEVTQSLCCKKISPDMGTLSLADLELTEVCLPLPPKYLGD